LDSSGTGLAGSCECGDEPSGSKEFWEFLEFNEQLLACQEELVSL
jgi:hypothetical protein